MIAINTFEQCPYEYSRLAKSLRALKCEDEAVAFAAWCCEESSQSVKGLDLTIEDKDVMAKEFGPFNKEEKEGRIYFFYSLGRQGVKQVL